LLTSGRLNRDLGWHPFRQKTEALSAFTEPSSIPVPRELVVSVPRYDPIVTVAKIGANRSTIIILNHYVTHYSYREIYA
jgi:hypothetical protein